MKIPSQVLIVRILKTWSKILEKSSSLKLKRIYQRKIWKILKIFLTNKVIKIYLKKRP